MIGGGSFYVPSEPYLLVFEVFSVSPTTGGGYNRWLLKQCQVVSRVYHLRVVDTLYAQRVLPWNILRATAPAGKTLRGDGMQISGVL